MEGLIPLVLKAMKRNKTRRQYEFLSSGSALSHSKADFYVVDHLDVDNPFNNITATTAATHADRQKHRRFSSVDSFSSSGVLPLEVEHHPTTNTAVSAACFPRNSKQLVRFRSQRLLS